METKRCMVMLFVAACLAAHGEMRKWTSVAGTTIDAEFV